MAATSAALLDHGVEDKDWGDANNRSDGALNPDNFMNWTIHTVESFNLEEK